MIFAAILCLLYPFLQTFTLLLSRRVISEPLKEELSQELFNELPSLSIVIAARNEEKTISAALTKLLAVKYPHLEIIFVNDRSSDSTGTLSKEISKRDSRLEVLDILELPDNWLGKNHALDCGFRKARGEWILFTDADVHFEPYSLGKILNFVKQRKLEYLAGFPRIYSRNSFLHGFMNYFAMQFFFFVRPWILEKDNRKGGFGVGAFNLVKKEVLEKIDGLRSVSLRPDDDVQLGMLIRRSGFRVGAARIDSEVSVEWYSSLSETLKGLEKNFFAGLDYKISATLGAVSFFLLHFFLLIWGLLSGPYQILFFLAFVWHSLNFLACCTLTGSPRRNSLFYFIYQLLFAYISLRTMILNLSQGGIYWREHFYPLKLLRTQKSLKDA